MEIIRGLHNLRAEHRGCVLAIGNFDGVHLGHQALLDRLKAQAEATGQPMCVQSFRPSAAAWFDPANAPPAVQPLRDTARTLADFGVARWSCLRFDGRFARFPAEDYIDQVLIGQLGVAAVVVGADFRFGAKRAGDVAMLEAAGRAHGFAVDTVGDVHASGERVSSTRLRTALGEGDLATAELLLGRAYSLSGVVRSGRQLGRDLGAATANMSFRDRLALRHGVYAVQMRCDGREWPGVANFGTRPTVDGGRPVLEAHALADTGALYGRQLTVNFHQFIRAEQCFDSVDALSAQIRADVSEARAYFGLSA
ncbi:bifunctional riboflavin kinase/FAD synthetase [Algiphilus aromaticivorans]|uniref:bifunctional riboflavin kinase/FAD synthetase n=1 Tax=Algiphilus aromaticivorans TaxID=382454 RepID=UPI0005C25E26|nr:bifunctional riboflavin kinase/FAD synthetase [Algiphilus aromaticivorans]